MKKLPLLFSLLLLCYSGFTQKLENEKNHIPPDFGKSKTHIVFQTVAGDPPMNKAIKKAFESNYTGSYEIISYKDPIGKKHNEPDTKYYWFKVITNRQSGDGSTEYSFGLREFDSLQVYRISFFSYTYGKILPAYIRMLDEVRKQNEANN